MWIKKVWDFIKSNWIILAIAVAFIAVCTIQFIGIEQQRRVLERDIELLQRDAGTIKTELGILNKARVQLDVLTAGIVQQLNENINDITRLDTLTKQNRDLLATIRAELKLVSSANSELARIVSDSITKVNTGTTDITDINELNEQNRRIYEQLEQRLKELAARYKINLK